jgi:hypothetical protein
VGHTVDVEAITELVCGDIFQNFKRHYEVNSYYDLNVRTAVNAITNAEADLARAGAYHSTTGPDLNRSAAYVAKWLADLRPIQVDKRHPVNLTNLNYLNASRINAAFATYFIFVATKNHLTLSDALLRDLRYCFEFRNLSMPAEAVALLLKHAKP